MHETRPLRSAIASLRFRGVIGTIGLADDVVNITVCIALSVVPPLVYVCVAFDSNRVLCTCGRCRVLVTKTSQESSVSKTGGTFITKLKQKVTSFACQYMAVGHYGNKYGINQRDKYHNEKKERVKFANVFVP